MITWMQRHKKWLIVTIWISTIAFVGAGFVGWGSYDYGKSNSTVAVVGDTEIPLTDLQNEYSSLYSQYQQMFGASFNKELAQQLKLEDAALQRVIQKTLLLNYASDLGLMVTDKEVAKELVKINSFFKDGKFDKHTYVTVLKQNRRTATEFEAQLKQDLLVQKIQNIFNLPLSKNEIKNISKLFYSQDKVSISILSSTNISIKPTSAELKSFWEKNKSNYKSAIGYSLEYTNIENIENKTKKDMKKVALRLYLKLKRDEIKFVNSKTIYANSTFLSKENFDKLTEAKEGNTLKPLYEKGKYIIAKFVKKLEPQILPYSQVIDQVKVAFIEESKNKILEERTNKLISNFKGKDIGYLSRDSKPNINNLNSEEVAQLINKIFTSTSKIDSIKLLDKVVVYKITDSKFLSYNNKNDEVIVSNVENIKNNLISATLLDKLKNRYEVKSFMGNN